MGRCPGFLRMPLLGPGCPAPGDGAIVRLVHTVNSAGSVEIPDQLQKFVANRILSRRKVQLWITQDGKCHWCGRDAWLREVGDAKKYTLGRRLCEATLDHLYSRLHPKRLTKPTHGEQRYVMACSQCNSRRSREECKALGIDEERRRSGRYPRRA